MFKLDSPLMNFLSKVADIMILNILIIVCSWGGSLSGVLYDF